MFFQTCKSLDNTRAPQQISGKLNEKILVCSKNILQFMPSFLILHNYHEPTGASSCITPILLQIKLYLNTNKKFNPSVYHLTARVHSENCVVRWFLSLCKHHTLMQIIVLTSPNSEFLRSHYCTLSSSSSKMLLFGGTRLQSKTSMWKNDSIHK